MTGGFGTPMRPQNAFTEANVKPGLWFIFYRAGEGGSGRRGQFDSHVHTSPDPLYDEGLVVEVKWRDGHTTIEVASELGLCHDRYTGRYGPGVCIPDDSE